MHRGHGLVDARHGVQGLGKHVSALGPDLGGVAGPRRHDASDGVVGVKAEVRCPAIQVVGIGTQGLRRPRHQHDRVGGRPQLTDHGMSG